MDFVDLDRVLDEFEEEEKQALTFVPGRELKPSGYIEFLEKHQEKDWEQINSSGPYSSTGGYTLERQAKKDPVSVSYDEPYSGSSSSKLGFIADQASDSIVHKGQEKSPDGKKLTHQSEIVTSLTRLSTKSEPIGTVYTSLNGYDRKGIANRSERKGTIACQAMEVQTDALSPASEEELMSSPFPKTDIIVDGHGDTSISNSESTVDNAGDHNHSPIYASMDHETIMSAGGLSSHDGSATQGFVSENQLSGLSHGQNVVHEKGEYSSLASGSGISEHVVTSDGVIGFGDTTGEDLDEDEVNMYLEELVEGSERNSDLSLVNGPSSSMPISGDMKNMVSGFQSLQYPANGVMVRSLADELVAAQPNLNNAPHEPSESLPKKFCPDTSLERHSELVNQNPDLVTSLGVNGMLDNTLQVSESSGETNQGCDVSNRGIVFNSVMKGTMEVENILQQRNQQQLHGVDGESHRNTVFNSVMEGRMEVETIVDDKIRERSMSIALGEKILQGNMEIEDVLNEAVYNQQTNAGHGVYESDNKLGDSALIPSGSNQPDVILGSVDEGLLETPSTEQGGNSLSPRNSSPDRREPGSPMLGIGARPKVPSAIKKNRPNSLLGLSKVNLDFPTVVKEVTDTGSNDQTTQHLNTQNPTNLPDVAPPEGYKQTQSVCIEPRVADEMKQRMNQESKGPVIIHDFTRPSGEAEPQPYSVEHSEDPYASSPPESSALGQQSGLSRMKRPTSLNLPHRPGFDVAAPEEEEDEQGNDQSSISSNGIDLKPEVEQEEEEVGAVGQSLDTALAPYPDSGEVRHSSLGYEPPFWIPDSEAPACMMCQAKFTMWKRRHHCRACGKVLCSTCCSQKALLPYLDNKEARVCSECYKILAHELRAGPGSNSPNPNNPNEYCSKVPPSQQASGNANPPVVMVPTGVLKTSGSQRKPGEPKQVMFSDGIRPGGDLTELDGPEQTRRRRSNRAGRKSGATPSTQTQRNEPVMPKTKEESLLRSPCLVPETGLPPLYVITGETGVIETDEALNQLDYTSDYKSEDGPLISYAVNKNLSVGVKIIYMDCCVNRNCWCFVTRGMNTAGQAELVVLLELSPEEAALDSGLVPPTDMFLHFHTLYLEALKGNFVCDMGHTIFNQNFLGSREHGGFLYLQPSFQCMTKLPVPECPYLFGILLQKWEVPWAKVFPIRLMLRLGAEYRYYPCPLVSVRNRKPVFFEIGHTIINLLADFRNYQYMLTQIRGATIHMENKKTIISFPRNRYNDVMKVVRNSNEHVMALGSSFSTEADSHLVCIQSEDGNYQTQAINIQNKPRLVTGASFVVFNGALKASTGLRAKSSIVEDGLMIQVLPETLASLKQALVDMTGFTIQCGPADTEVPEESVEIRWADNDKGFNLGVKSYLDGASLEGVESVSVKCPMDVLGTGEVSKGLAIRWTRVYFLQHDELSTSHFDPLDLSRLTEDVAQACCLALARHLGQLKLEGQVRLGLRVNLTRDAVGYEMGSLEKTLPPGMVSDLDTFLVPIVHQASEEGIIMELVFNIVD